MALTAAQGPSTSLLPAGAASPTPRGEAAPRLLTVLNDIANERRRLPAGSPRLAELDALELEVMTDLSQVTPHLVARTSADLLKTIDQLRAPQKFPFGAAGVKAREAYQRTLETAYTDLSVREKLKMAVPQDPKKVLGELEDLSRANQEVLARFRSF